MSVLEGQAQPHIEGMFSGGAKVLDQLAQSIISAWAMKTTLVLEGISDAPDRFYSYEECRSFSTLSAFPRRSAIWLGACVDRALLLSSRTLHYPTSEPVDCGGVSTTIALGGVVFQILTVRIPSEGPDDVSITTDVLRGPWEHTTLQIWPVLGKTLSWPPQLAFSGNDDLDVLADRFVAAGKPLVETQLLTF